jgi:hypothetical protein
VFVRVRRRLLLALAALTLLALAGCHDEQGATARHPSSPDPVSIGSKVTPSASGVPYGDSAKVLVDVVKLVEGPLPAVDVVLGRKLIHDGAEIDLRLPADARFPIAMGTYHRTPIIGTGLGSQMFTVAADGATSRLGRPHETYNSAPRLVTQTGHLLVFYNDRGTALSTYTVLDASNGKEVAVLKDTRRRSADLSSLDPADRAVIRAVSGFADPSNIVAAVSPDRLLAITRTTADPDDPQSPTVLRAGPVGDRGGTTFRFTTPTGDVAFESDHAFLVALAVSNGDAVEPRYVVVRCTTGGECERATGPATGVSIAGSGDVQLGG